MGRGLQGCFARQGSTAGLLDYGFKLLSSGLGLPVTWWLLGVGGRLLSFSGGREHSEGLEITVKFIFHAPRGRTQLCKRG